MVLGTVGLVAYYFFTKKDSTAAVEPEVDIQGEVIFNPDGSRQVVMNDGTIFRGQGPAQPGTVAYDEVNFLANIPGTTQADIDLYVSPKFQGLWLDQWSAYMRDWYLQGKKMYLDSPYGMDPYGANDAHVFGRSQAVPANIRDLMNNFPTLQRFGGMVK